MAKEDEDNSKEVLKVGKKDDSASPDPKDESQTKEKKEPEYPQAAPAAAASYPGQYAPPPPPPAQPMFTSANLSKMVAIGLLVGIILLFVAGLLAGGAYFADQNFGDVVGGAKILGSIGLFLAGIFIVLPLMTVRDLTEEQKLFIIIILAGIIVGFAFLI
jgi:hypothetical protein